VKTFLILGLVGFAPLVHANEMASVNSGPVARSRDFGAPGPDTTTPKMTCSSGKPIDLDSNPDEIPEKARKAVMDSYQSDADVGSITVRAYCSWQDHQCHVVSVKESKSKNISIDC
jgi:tryptophanyl-tRNA synthetase